MPGGDEQPGVRHAAREAASAPPGDVDAPATSAEAASGSAVSGTTRPRGKHGGGGKLPAGDRLQPQVDEQPVVDQVAERRGAQPERRERHEHAEPVRGDAVRRRLGRFVVEAGEQPDQERQRGERTDPEHARDRHLGAHEQAVQRDERDDVPGGGLPWPRRRRSSLHHVAEDALEIGVERTHLEQAGAALPGDRRKRVRERAGVRRVELEHVLASRRTPTAAPASTSAAASSRGRSVRTRTRIGRSSMSARRSRKSPAAASRPCDMTSTCEPSRSTSSSTWLDTITHRPSPPSRRNSATMSMRWRGSRPVSGSSRTSTAGSWTIACATFTRWRMPFE